MGTVLPLSATSACGGNESKPEPPQDTKTTPLRSKELTNIDGKEELMLSIEYAWGYLKDRRAT